ncbi:hypothetical protein XFF1815_900282 [Xanthomonas citri pv. fuscans]|nr:hypothetical protein XFF6960_590179 [Xanthomonas citri pv. fuscans]SOO45941.1 hypothetical protein XFF1815_900282 [Xanthomonas citri pv. fuscans]
MPAAVAIVCLSGYVAFSTLVFHRNNDRLEAVRDVHFPMLDAMTRNVAALDKLINGLNGAAAAGDADMLAATKPVADEIHGSYVKLQKSDPANAQELARLGKQFDQYYSLAQGVAAAFVEQREPDATQMSAMAPALGDVPHQSHRHAEARRCTLPRHRAGSGGQLGHRQRHRSDPGPGRCGGMHRIRLARGARHHPTAQPCRGHRACGVVGQAGQHHLDRPQR